MSSYLNQLPYNSGDCNELIIISEFVVCYCEGDFKVSVVPSQTVTQVLIVKLQSDKTPSNYLAIRGGNVHGKVSVYDDNNNKFLFKAQVNN